MNAQGWYISGMAWSRRPRPQAIPSRAESGPPQRRVSPWTLGTGDPGAWTSRHESRPSGEPRSLRTRNRNAREYPSGRSRNPQTQCPYLTLMLEGKYTEAFLAHNGEKAQKYTADELGIISSQIVFWGSMFTNLTIMSSPP